VSPELPELPELPPVAVFELDAEPPFPLFAFPVLEVAVFSLFDFAFPLSDDEEVADEDESPPLPLVTEPMTWPRPGGPPDPASAAVWPASQRPPVARAARTRPRPTRDADMVVSLHMRSSEDVRRSRGHAGCTRARKAGARAQSGALR
jgi:hypothetical protein